MRTEPRKRSTSATVYGRTMPAHRSAATARGRLAVRLSVWPAAVTITAAAPVSKGVVRVPLRAMSRS